MSVNERVLRVCLIIYIYIYKFSYQTQQKQLKSNHYLHNECISKRGHMFSLRVITNRFYNIFILPKLTRMQDLNSKF